MSVGWALVSVGAGAARATVYDINLLAPGNQIGQYVGPCYCSTDNGFVSKVFTGNPGDEFNFGSVTIYPLIANIAPDAYDLYYPGDPNGPYFPTIFLTSAVGVSFSGDAGDWPFPGFNIVECTYPDTCQGEPSTVKLDYVISGNSIQLDWFGDYSYVAPVPEPSTWAMLLIGFAGLGLMARRRSMNAKSEA